MIFDRVKPLDAILAAAEKKSLSRSLGWFQLTLMGIGCVIGTGIFVLTAVGAQKAGPGLMIAFAIAGGVCIVAALCYAEIAAMIPVAGSAYTYSYATIGEFFAWTVGWALIMEYAIAASAVSVGWSGYFSGTVLGGLGIHLPAWLSAGPLALGGAAGGFINLPALVIALLVTGLLVIGTSESAKVNAVLVIVKVTALTAFVAITLTSSEFEASHFNPFLPAGVFGGWGTGVGAVGAAATMFFAYVGFDAVSTAAEETKNPQRNVPIGLVGSLLFCTIFYILVAAGAIGTIGGQPIMDAMGIPLEAGSPELARQCAMPQYADALVCSNEPLAHVLKMLGFSGFGNAIGLAAFLALPSVITLAANASVAERFAAHELAAQLSAAGCELPIATSEDVRPHGAPRIAVGYHASVEMGVERSQLDELSKQYVITARAKGSVACAVCGPWASSACMDASDDRRRVRDLRRSGRVSSGFGATGLP